VSGSEVVSDGGGELGMGIEAADVEDDERSDSSCDWSAECSFWSRSWASAFSDNSRFPSAIEAS